MNAESSTGFTNTWPISCGRAELIHRKRVSLVPRLTCQGGDPDNYSSQTGAVSLLTTTSPSDSRMPASEAASHVINSMLVT